jgi:inorganic pyrophosphatase
MTSEDSWIARIEPSDDPAAWVPVINEIASGSCCKYRLDKKTGQLALARALPPDVSFPANYGFIPHTRSDADDEETDVMVLSGEPLLPLTIVRARIVGGFIETTSHKQASEPRLLAVAIDDPAVEQIRDLQDLPQSMKARIEAFVLASKENQEVEVTFDQWLDRGAALAHLRRAFEAARKRPPK